MLRKYFIAAGTLAASLFCSQNCNPQSAASQVGAKGCVTFTYQKAPVYYQTVRAADGNEWLLQNLGSSRVAGSISDEAARGDYFQFGRWDDGHQKKDSKPTEVLPNPNNPLGLGAGTEYFYIGGGSPWTSNYTGWFANPDQDDTWAAKDLSEVTGHNGIDPCKAIGEGWEMPSEADWDVVMQKENIFPKPEGATSTGIQRAFNSNLKIAGAGARKEETFAFEGQRGYLWTKTASKNPNFYRYVYLGTAASSTTGFGGDAKSFGYSVRCVKKSNPLGVQNPASQSFKIFPNPAKNFVNIQSANKIKTIEIYTSTGEKIREIKGTGIVDISGYSIGIYVFKFIFENGDIQVERIIKN